MDIAHKQTEKILSQIERRVRKEYRQASKEVEQKLDRYFAAFRRKDEAKRELVKSGELSKQDYKAWRTSQLAVGKRWENMKDQLAQDYTNATVIARNISDGYMPEVYAINHNFATYQVETSAKVNTSYTLYSQQSVERLMRENPDILPQVGRTTQELIDSGVLKKWEMKNIQSTMIQGILQGESINALAKRMAYDVGATNYKDCVKHARTMTTATQNAGRADGYKRAEKMGIDMEQEWVAVLDGRTRHEHRQLDGQRRPVGEPFEVDGYKLDYPADPKAPYYLIMNCRCTLIGQLKGFERDTKEYRQDPDLDGMSYEEWKQAKAPKKAKATQAAPVQKQTNTASLAGLKKPIRPESIHRDDFNSEEEYWDAREKRDKVMEEYKAEREEYNKKVDEFIEQSLSQYKEMSVADMENWCKDHGIKIYGDITGVDGRALTAYTERMEKLSKEFPEVMKYREKLPIEKQFQSYEFAFEKDRHDFVAEASHGFTFGSLGSDMKALLWEQANAVGEGTRVLGDGTINQLFDHEFGHNVMDAIRYANGRNDDTAKRSVALEKDLIASVYNKEGMSEYASTNANELFAEAFSAWYGGEQTEFAKSFGEFLRRWL